MSLPALTVVYFHGFASGRKNPSPKTELVQQLGHALVWVVTGGDYRPQGYLHAFSRIADPLPAATVLMGTSLGGFWARYLGSQLRRPWIALNPALQPADALAQATGTQRRWDIEESFLWLAEDAEAYRVYQETPVDTSVPGLLIVAEDDELLPYRQTLLHSGTAETLILPQGGHALQNTAEYAEAIQSFCARAQARFATLMLNGAERN
jgi:predicted esterase YcpF (UPF0227 family)